MSKKPDTRCELNMLSISASDQNSDVGTGYRHSIALSSADQRLSYEALDRRADRFASYLMQAGVVPGGAVAICMERSFDWIVAALGIMRVGAAYVPLDPAWPDSRLRYAVHDSGATVLVARTALLDRFQITARGIDPLRDAAAIAAAPEMSLPSVQADSLAYVIYTSGSSGVPKGVEITHANLSHLIRWHRETFKVTRDDRASHLAGLGFDAAVWEVWPHLAAGATVCLADDQVRSSPELLQQWMIRERVTIAFVPTVHAAPMIAMEWPSTTTLRVLLTGGDVLRHAPAVNLPFDLVNNYGPTECTVVATSTVVKPGSQGMPPIGRPILGASVYLLNERGEQVADGSTGEICVGGGGVGRGYRNLSESTGRSFVPDPFADTPGARMYRTGDRGVRRPDGEIEFRGRIDRQTKIRGKRVELDEIASGLGQYPGIDFATATSNVSEGGENELVAYVLAQKNASGPTVRDLQEHLRASLPDYMVPAVFVRLKTLPLSPNGKLDLSLLPRPTNKNMSETKIAKALPTPIEKMLLAIARKLLKNPAVRAEDNFFLAGGHSLLGMQLVIRVHNAFGVDLTLRQLFEAPTVERLALLIETMLREKHIAVIWSELLGRTDISLDDNFFDLGGHPVLVAALQQRIVAEHGQLIPLAELFHSPTIRQQAMLSKRIVKPKPVLPPGVLALNPNPTLKGIFWVHYLSINLAKVIGKDRPFTFVVLTAEDFSSLGTNPTLQSIAACLMRKILATQPQGPYTIGGFCAGGVLAYEIAYQMQVAGHEVSVVLMLDAPNLTYSRSHESLTNKVGYSRYALKRAARLGLTTTLTYLGEHLQRHLRCLSRSAGSEMRVAQDLVRSAVFAYRPKQYEGKVLLLMATERAPHLDLLAGWQAVVPNNLHTEYVVGHRRDLLQMPTMRLVADIIVSHLTPAVNTHSSAHRADDVPNNRLQIATSAKIPRLLAVNEATGLTRISGK
jgi:amino acid adenylation domain-containing protein